MLDPRITRLAELLCDHSTRLTSEDRVMIHAGDLPYEAVAEFVRVARSRGAIVEVKLDSTRVARAQMLGMDEGNARHLADTDLYQMKKLTAYIALRGADNPMEGADVPSETKQLWQREYVQPVHLEQRVRHTKWVALRWPTPSMALQAGMSTDGFEDFYFRVCTMDYPRMREAAEPLRERMANTDLVRLVGPGTDLTFSIKGVGAVQCCGLRNIPDGECFSAPVPGSMNGVVQYNVSSLHQGVDFKGVRFVVRDGRIVEATCESGQNELLNRVLDTDEGGRSFGEFALGYNPAILHPMKDTLFDEKIAGSFHLTPGHSYPPPGGNGNVSAIHWDIVCIQRPEYGGGEVWFDGELVRKDGLFVVTELEGLNPDRLGG